VLIISPSIANIPAGGSVVFFAPPQVTRGELRFPKLDTLTWSGGGAPGEGGPRCSWPYWCRLSSDSVSGQVYFPGAIDPPANSGLAYHVVARLEIGGSLTEVPVKPDPLGGFWRNYSNLPHGWGGPGHPGFLKAPVRDSAGVALEPKVISVRWENFAGVMDSVIPPYATGSGTGQLVDCYFARR
jgi:hypothetical protein